MNLWEREAIRPFFKHPVKVGYPVVLRGEKYQIIILRTSFRPSSVRVVLRMGATGDFATVNLRQPVLNQVKWLLRIVLWLFALFYIFNMLMNTRKIGYRDSISYECTLMFDTYHLPLKEHSLHPSCDKPNNDPISSSPPLQPRRQFMSNT